MDCLNAMNFQPYFGIGKVTFHPKNQGGGKDKRMEGKERSGGGPSTSGKGEGVKDRSALAKDSTPKKHL